MNQFMVDMVKVEDLDLQDIILIPLEELLKMAMVEDITLAVTIMDKATVNNLD